MFDHTVKYDFERLESVPDMFEPGEMVIATEKLHGTFVSIIWEPELNHPEMFGETGSIIVHSKGLGSQGLAFKNVPANDGNLYVRTLKSLLDAGLEHSLQMLASRMRVNKRIVIVGEIYGKGVQDLAYNTDKPEFCMFDLLIDDTWQPRDSIGFSDELLFIKAVPLVYQGPFDVVALEAVRDGNTMLGGANIREGVVVRSAHEERHAIHGRKICKMISPDYLLRKVKGGEATEYT